MKEGQPKPRTPKPVLYPALFFFYGMIGLCACGEDNTFQAELIRVDTASVTSIVIEPGEKQAAISLKREGKTWIASRENISVRAVPEPVHLLLRNLSLIRTKYLATQQPDRWRQYGVAEGEGARVRVYQEENLLEDFFIGQFEADPEQRAAVSYLRLAGQNEVFAVDGFRAIPFTQRFNRYRDPTLLRLAPELNIDRMEYRTPDTSFTFVSDGAHWLGKGEFRLDSAAMNGYLRRISRVESNFFADHFDELMTTQLPHYAIKLYAGPTTAASIRLYRDSTRTERPFILQSSQRPDTFFASDSSGLFKTIFATPAGWVQQQESNQLKM